jgi:hypothetical protein
MKVEQELNEKIIEMREYRNKDYVFRNRVYSSWLMRIRSDHDLDRQEVLKILGKHA